MIKYPNNLKGDCTNQIDQLLTVIGSRELLAVSLSTKTTSGHVSTQLVLDALIQIADVSANWVQFSLVDEQSLSRAPLLCVGKGGDTFLLSQRIGSKFLLSRFSKPGEVSDSFWVSQDELLNEMDVLPQALSVTKKQSTSAFAQPLLPPPSKDADLDGNATKEHYVIRHFRRQSRTALSIIGISVVIALLGVITPLGFQTFTDKILPYQAQSSLMVIAILLVVAAMMTALFNYYHDYQQSVLFAKYQSGLGKEVFKRLLAMEVPYFDSRNVGELTKLVDQVKEASNFLVKQLLGAVVALISLLVVLPVLFL